MAEKNHATVAQTHNTAFPYSTRIPIRPSVGRKKPPRDESFPVYAFVENVRPISEKIRVKLAQ